MRAVGSRVNDVEGKTDSSNITVVGPPLPSITGIAAWDSALLEDYHRRKRARKLAVETAVAAAAAEAAAAAAAEASELSGEDAAPVAMASPSVPRGAQKPCDITVDDSTRAATTAGAGAYCEEKNDGNDGTRSESSNSMSTPSTMSGSDDGHESCDSAQEQDGHEAEVDILDHDSGCDVDGERQPTAPTSIEEQPVHDTLGGSEQSSANIQDPEEQQLHGFEPQRVEMLEEAKSPSEGGRPPVKQGKSKSSVIYSQMPTRKLRGFHGALELATRCLRKDGFNAKAYVLRAELEARLGRRERAIADFRAAASLDVGDPRPRINMVCTKRSIQLVSSFSYLHSSHFFFLCSNGTTQKD